MHAHFPIEFDSKEPNDAEVLFCKLSEELQRTAFEEALSSFLLARCSKIFSSKRASQEHWLEKPFCKAM